ncbi:LssY C-terminal domain-containing protein [Microbacterium invictum]|uniref:LssY C-terminal domain-containing protein n=1 Tax=Microbacterium invictum TaxID=515415 RepID=UPI003A10079B
MSPRSERARRRRISRGAAVDWFFFVFAGLAAIWLAYLSLTESFRVGWWGLLVAIAFWVLLAYLVLPRLHRILTTIYVPDYFIGRTRTSDGLLGDPVNLAFLGEAEQIKAALRVARWTEADPVTLASSWRIVTSTLSRRSYGEAPVSPLFLFGRQQDFAFQQEVDGNPAKRHHVRFWRCPDDWLLPGGYRVDWLAAGTFDTAVGLSLFTLQITHRIDADTDIERDHIVRSLREGAREITVNVIADFSTGYHSRNGGGDSIRTDGDLPVVDVRAVRVPEAPSARAAGEVSA